MRVKALELDFPKFNKTRKVHLASKAISNQPLRQYVMSANKLHADDTPAPVLAPDTGKTKLDRLWTYVRDDRPAGDSTAPAVWFTYSPDRKGEHPHRHLATFAGTLQADGYAGFNQTGARRSRLVTHNFFESKRAHI